MGQTVRFVISLFVVITAALLQSSPLISFGVKPNLILLTVIAALFFEGVLWRQLSIIFVASLMLKFQPGVEVMNISFILITLFSIPLRDRLPWKHEVNFFVIVVAATIAFYLLHSPLFFTKDLGAFTLELLYNSILSFPALWFFSLIYGKEKKLRKIRV